MTRRSFAGLLLAGMLVLTWGCGGEIPRSRVHGTILYKGRPVTETTIILMASDSQAYRAELDKAGKYSIDGVARGTIKVSLQQAPARVPRRPDPPGASGKNGTGEQKDSVAPPSEATKRMFELPLNYADADNSGLTFELKESVQEWSIDLK